ncbi:MAG: hypothetical protein EOM91_12035 [Sphingobacteriia bacterium]|nr:hypothetical protein [Sphingobacteriia bacterium]NCC39876.1 hypothetical protein [Gammaproteobacteria bacterium]
MLVRARTMDACRVYRFEGGVSAWTIAKSVGLGGVNRKEDVLTIQTLLNRIAVVDGGPLPPLQEDSLIGPKTMGAIRHFQQWHQLVADARVDPSGPTLKRMNELPKRALAERNAALLSRLAASMPDLIAMAKSAQRIAEAAIDHLQLGTASLTGTQRPYQLADLYFAFGQQSQSQTLLELRFIRATFVRVGSVLTSRHPSVFGGNPFGVSIFTIDPLGKDWMAYSVMQAGDERREIPEVHSGHVYLCRSLDQVLNEDLFKHIMFHEMIHFVDDESKERQIIDHGYKEHALKLTHQLRMHNADNYALFASHAWFGRARLVASQPSLAGLIPNHL